MMGEVEINDSWSLTAVVRECARKARLRAQLTVDTPQTNTTPITTNISPLGSSNNSYSPKQNFDQFVLENNSASFMLPSAAGATTAAPAADRCTSRDELINEMTYKPFLSKNNSMVEATNHLIPPNPQQQLQIRNLNKRQGSSDIGHHFIEKRNRKYEDRRVVKCSLEELSKNEKWAWRKYGQKPIKGSPYPRNYYRCSTMKGCKARKQVERSPVDPNIYIVTYTSYHLHPYPNLRSYHGPRAKPRGSDPDPTLESESPFNTDPGQNGSGSGSGSGCEKVRIEEELDDNDEGGGGDESFGCGGMMDGRNNNEDEILMIAKTTADSDLLTGMEQFCGGEKISAGSSNSNSNSNDYNKNVGFDEMIINYGSESRMNNEEVQMEDNKWLENDINNNGVGIRDMYASAPATLAGAHETPSSVGNNIWDSGIIKPQFYSF